MYELVKSAPPEQITRCKIAYKAYAKGEWAEVIHTLSNAAKEEEARNPGWALDAYDVIAQARMNGNL